MPPVSRFSLSCSHRIVCGSRWPGRTTPMSRPPWPTCERTRCGRSSRPSRRSTGPRRAPESAVRSRSSRRHSSGSGSHTAYTRSARTSAFRDRPRSRSSLPSASTFAPSRRRSARPRAEQVWTACSRTPVRATPRRWRPARRISPASTSAGGSRCCAAIPIRSPSSGRSEPAQSASSVSRPPRAWST